MGNTPPANQTPQANQTLATGTPSVPPATTVVLNEDDITRFVRERSRVEAIDPRRLEETDLYSLPLIPGKSIKERCYSSGKLVEYERSANIQDVNPDIRYIFLTMKDLQKTPDYMNNFFIATRDNHEGRTVP